MKGLSSIVLFEFPKLTQRVELWKKLILFILLVLSWRAGQTLEGFSIARIAGSEVGEQAKLWKDLVLHMLANRPSFGGM